MVTIVKYNPERDLMAVVPDLAIDLAGAIESGIVLDTGMIAEHNEIENPACIIGRVRDVFDAFEAHRAIVSAEKAAAAARAADAAAAAASTSAAAAAVTPSSTPTGV